MKIIDNRVICEMCGYNVPLNACYEGKELDIYDIVNGDCHA